MTFNEKRSVFAVYSSIERESMFVRIRAVARRRGLSTIHEFLNLLHFEARRAAQTQATSAVLLEVSPEGATDYIPILYLLIFVHFARNERFLNAKSKSNIKRVARNMKESCWLFRGKVSMQSGRDRFATNISINHINRSR